MKNITTFVELYDYLKNDYKEENLNKFFEEPWAGKNKQESVYRLFCYLEIIKFNGFTPCIGNFNNGSLKEVYNTKDFFIKNDIQIKLKDKGDISDLTFKKKKELLITSSKDLKNMKLSNLDLQDIDNILNSETYKNYNGNIILVVKNKKDYNNTILNSEKSSKYLVNIINNRVKFVLDQEDLSNYYKIFKSNEYNIFSTKLNCVDLRFHQELAIYKILKYKNEGRTKVLLGHIPRSGKSYTIYGSILEDFRKNNGKNYLIITTCPNETITQYFSILENLKRDFNIIRYSKNSLLKENNIIILSKQFLQSKIGDNLIKSLTQIKWSICFIDEAHNGGSTEISKNLLNLYCSKTFTVFITATYFKPSNIFSIENECKILWDLEDIQLCKNFSKNIGRIQEKYGKEVMEISKKFNIKNLENQYKKYPELCIFYENILEEKITELNKSLIDCNDNLTGYSIDSLFSLNDIGNFIYEKEIYGLWKRILGNINNIGENSYINRITKLNNRNVKVILVFLPQNGIDKISNATKNLLTKHKYNKIYNICIINSLVSNNPKELVNSYINSDKDVIVLSGRQCSMGVSIKECDLVILMNNNTSFDMIFQMMFRCLTEDTNKSYGFVIDVNYRRSIKMIIEYSKIIRKDLSINKSLEYLLKTKLIRLYFEDCFELNEDERYKKIFNKIYNFYVENKKELVNDMLRLICNYWHTNKDIDLYFKMTKTFKTLSIEENINEKVIKNDGIYKEIKNNDKKSKEKDDKKSINFYEILSNIIPIVSVLTYNLEEYNSFENSFRFVIENEELLYILQEYMKLLCSKDTIKATNILFKIYKDINNKQEMDDISNIIKKLLKEAKNDTKKLSKLLDEFLVPKKEEKKNNAEVSTPYNLRQEMLDKINSSFWKKPRKVFEPCSGKGGFLIDIIDRFMDGLTEAIPDKEERYRVIVEECLYWGDINPLNIFVCKMLLGDYKLNYNQGDTLQLDTSKWVKDGFDLVIGNPPYNKNGCINTGNTIWQKFVEKSLNEWVKNGGMLVFVHPASWRKPEGGKSRNNGLFKLMCHDNTMTYLEIHDTKDGMKTFKCGTRYDWYCIIKKRNKNYKTTVKDEDGIILSLNLRDFHFLSNKNIEFVYKLLAKDNEEKCVVLYSRNAYGADKKHVSRTKTEKFRYPLIHSTTKTGIRYCYTNDNTIDFFGKSKVIFGETGINEVVIDADGEYGMTQNSIGLGFNTQEEAKKLKETLESDTFKNLVMKSCSWSIYRIDWRLFTYFRKDFWKEFT